MEGMYMNNLILIKTLMINGICLWNMTQFFIKNMWLVNKYC